MPLLDHFHAPLYPTRSWESFHSRWAALIADHLDSTLPDRYFAEVQTHLGTRVEADVAEFEQTDGQQPQGNGAAGGAGTAVQTWAPPAAAVVLAGVFPDEFEVRILDERDDARLVGVVELVSPGNTDREDARRAFAAKCSTYLQRGVGVVVVDIVTGRHFNLHEGVVELVQPGAASGLAEEVWLYAVAYRPLRRGQANQIDVWPAPLAVGQPLPTLPLALRGGPVLPLDLEALYTEARRRTRL
jgi:hypothetical protein